MNKTSYFLSKIFRISNSVSRAANSAFAGRMWPAGREFEIPGLIIQMHTSLLRWRLNLTLQISQGSASIEVGI